MVNGSEIETRAVVCAFPPQLLASEIELEPLLPGKYRNRLAFLESSYGVCIELGLAEPLTDDGRMVLSGEPPYLVWATSNVSPGIAPEGK